MLSLQKYATAGFNIFLCCRIYLKAGYSLHPSILPVALVQLDHLIFQLLSVIWRKAKFADVVTAILIGVVVAELGLHGVGAQQGKRDEGAGQPAGHDVVSQLQAEVVPAGEHHHHSDRACQQQSSKEPGVLC